MKFSDVIKALDAHKGDGTWLEVAKLSGLHYDTVARIARGAMGAPSVQTVEKIAAALDTLFPTATTSTEDAKA